MESQGCIRLVFLGGPCTGKTSLVSRLTIGKVREVHYPTQKKTSWLFKFTPKSRLARAILDEKVHERCYYDNGNNIQEAVFKSPSIDDVVLLSPLVYNSLIEEYNRVKVAQENCQRLSIAKKWLKSENTHYQYLADTEDIELHNGCLMLTEKYNGPAYSEICVEVIDTPGFNPNMMVPFVELSSLNLLDRSVPRELEDQQYRFVSQDSLLVGSGMSQLNSKVDGYVIIYSALPELVHKDPPEYDFASKQFTHEANCAEQDGGFAVLKNIRECYLDAWTEFRNYQQKWMQDKGSDCHDRFCSSKQLDKIDLNPESAESPPPIILICTHLEDPLHSPKLVEQGKKLAVEWNCGFVALDNISDYNVDVAISCIIRDIVEKEKLIRKQLVKKKGVLQRIIKG